MLASIKKFFDSHLLGEGTQSVLSQEHRLKIATVALLLETARADFNIRDEELDDVARHAQHYFGLEPQETEELLKLAEEEAGNATCYYEFTSLINQSYTQEQKISIIEMMWRVAYSDRELEKYEEALIRKIADLLYVPHSAFIAAKHRVLGDLDLS